MVLRKTLSRHGNSLALVIERPVLELLGIDAQTELEVATDGFSLVITPVRDMEKQRRFLGALMTTSRRYQKLLKGLEQD